jgi:regulator of protease activity HflC (stomatin/prohibitin superfamily)
MLKNEKIENEIEEEVRRRTGGKHVEIASVTIEAVDYAPEIATAVRQKLVAEQDALRQKAAVEAEALRKRTQIETEAAAAKLKAQADADDEKRRAELDLLKLRNARATADEQMALEKSAAQARLVKARADAEQMQILAVGETAANRAHALAVSPLMVQQEGFKALAELGGSGAAIYLGDWSHVPNFLFPHGLLTTPLSLTLPPVASTTPPPERP